MDRVVSMTTGQGVSKSRIQGRIRRHSELNARGGIAAASHRFENGPRLHSSHARHTGHLSTRLLARVRMGQPVSPAMTCCGCHQSMSVISPI